MKFLLVQDSLVLFLLLSEEVVLAFSVVRLWSLSLLFLQFTLLEQTKTVFQQTQPLPFRAKRQAVEGKVDNRRGAGEQWGQRGEERQGEERRRKKRSEGTRGKEKSMQFHPPRRSPAAPCSQYPTSRRPYSETHLMNTPALIQPHNGALHSHWACSQWRTSPQLNPRDNELG